MKKVSLRQQSLTASEDSPLCLSHTVQPYNILSKEPKGYFESRAQNEKNNRVLAQYNNTYRFVPCRTDKLFPLSAI